MTDKEAIEDIYKRYQNIDPNDKFFKKRIRQRNPYIRYAAVILGIVLLSSSITIGNNFFNYYSKSKVGYIDEGLYTAIENNYMQNITMDYINSNNVGVKVTNVLMDSSKIYLVFDFKFYKPLTDDVHKLKMPDLLISDENNNVLYCDDLNRYQKFCKENNLEYIDAPYTDQPIFSFNYSPQFIEKTPTHIQYLIILNANETYPNSQKLYIDFSKLSLSIDLTTYGNDTEKTIEKNGKWNLELNLK